VGHEGRTGETRITSNFGPETLKGRDHSEDIGVDGKVILEWILGK
jgi:hypothetical protein